MLSTRYTCFQVMICLNVEYSSCPIEHIPTYTQPAGSCIDIHSQLGGRAHIDWHDHMSPQQGDLVCTHIQNKLSYTIRVHNRLHAPHKKNDIRLVALAEISIPPWKPHPKEKTSELFQTLWCSRSRPWFFHCMSEKTSQPNGSRRAFSFSQWRGRLWLSKQTILIVNTKPL